jgi:RNA polymerase sigma factor (sigma-70 family)
VPDEAAPEQVSLTSSPSPESSTPLDNVGPSSVITPRVVSALDSASPASLAGTLGSLFRITRAPASDTPLEVRYTLTVYGPGGATAQEGTATISPGSDHVDVPIEQLLTGKANGLEIVTLTLQKDSHYETAQPCATLFLAGSSQRCSEVALLAAYWKGSSTEAFRALVEHHRPTVLRTCYRVLGSWEDAEDVSQVVFLVLARRQIRMQTTLAGWLGRVARNTAIMFLRSRTRRSRHEQRAAKADQVVSEESDHDLREELDAALMQMPAPLREAVRLRYLEGLSQQEAAQVVGCPRGTLSQRASHGLRWLRGILGFGSSD